MDVRVLVLVALILGISTPPAGAQPGVPPPNVTLTDIVKGQLIRIQGEERKSYVLLDDHDVEVRIEISQDTFLDRSIQVGDVVEAQVSYDGHTRSVMKAGQ